MYKLSIPGLPRLAPRICGDLKGKTSLWFMCSPDVVFLVVGLLRPPHLRLLLHVGGGSKAFVPALPFVDVVVDQSLFLPLSFSCDAACFVFLTRVSGF